MTVKRLTQVITVALTVSAAFIAVPSAAQASEPEYWAAIAYSPSTGAYGYAVRHDANYQASIVALKNCGSKDAKVVILTRHRYIAFASGLLGYGTGYASTAEEAKTIALRNSQKHAPLGTIKFCAANCSTR